MAVQDEYPDVHRVSYRGVWGNSTEKESSSISYEILWDVPYYNIYIYGWLYPFHYILMNLWWILYHRISTNQRHPTRRRAHFVWPMTCHTVWALEAAHAERFHDAAKQWISLLGLKKRNNTVKSNCFNCWSLMFLLSNCHKFQKIPITSSKNHPKFP